MNRYPFLMIKPFQFRTFTTTATHFKESTISKLNLFADSKPPQNNIESISKTKGIIFSSGLHVPSSKSAFMIAGQVIELSKKPTIVNRFMFDLESDLAFLRYVNPLPELMVLGLGYDGKSMTVTPGTTKLFNELGVRLEVSNVKNAAKSYDLLATERPNQVMALICAAE